MKKVLLINSNTEIIPYPVAPLGLALVAKSLLNNYKVKVYDFAFGRISDLINVVNDYRPDYIGISVRNIDNVTMRKCKWYIQDIKDSLLNPIKEISKVPIILGGSGFSIAPIEMLNFLKADYGIVGEAEMSFFELLQCLDNKARTKSIPGLISKGDRQIGSINYLDKQLHISKSDIDKFIDFEFYKKRGSYPIQTKRGCTHKCIYCSYPNIEGKKYRLRPVSEIVDEIEDISKRIPNVAIEFVDSTFNSPLNHAIDICKEIIRRDLKLQLRTMGVNPGDVTEELIILMKEAGFSQIDCTPDSASRKIIKEYRKNFTKKRLIECAEIIRKHDMPTMWFFMLGAPGETEETILETFKFIDNYIFEEDMVHITEGIRIIPNTELYDKAIQDGVILNNDNVLDPMFYVSPSIGRENLTRILEREIGKRHNVLNSIDTEPSKELMQNAINYRKENHINEPMFRTLLRLESKVRV
jgi:radical SAM superfamily enzyme YgiQ (UPF0313 family)